MTDRARGALLGLAIGDALGMPIDGLSHINVRTYYRGIKEFRDDEKRGELKAGQWTAHTQHARALAAALAHHPSDLEQARGLWRQGLAAPRRRVVDRPYATGAAAACSAPLGLWWAHGQAEAPEALEWTLTLLADVDPHPDALAAAFAVADATRRALSADPEVLDGPAFLGGLAESARLAEAATGASGAVSDRIERTRTALDDFPLDLQDLCGGTGHAADEAVPFALAMVARNPTLAEASLLAGINVGGAAAQIGAVAGALLGALNGASAFPAEWRDGLEASGEIAAEADRLSRDSG